MTELVGMHNTRQMVQNEKERIPVRVAQELLYVFVADARICFSSQLLEQRPLLG